MKENTADSITIPYVRQMRPYREWSPGIHYAQAQTMPTGKLNWRRLYDFELLYVSQGAAVTTMHDAAYPLQAGQMILLPPGVWHQNEVLSEPHAKFIGIHFDFLGEMDVQCEDDMVVNENHVQPRKFAVEAVSDEFSPLSDHLVYHPSPAVVEWMEQLIQEFSMRSPGYKLICKGLMLNILVSLLRTQMARRIAKSTPHGPQIAALMQAVEADPSHDWSSRSLASRANMHEDHLAKLFKRIAGKPPGEFVADIRHREARRLLRETEQTVMEIGQQVGYEDLHYFSRVFKRHEGISPREYRKLARML
ncbi:AraC-like DNA-binding protein/mannose-6-phosphate isomerase-like protein (cupin superfamily) [Paenibacillus phyllosphaerae]|uniref:AraC-like DNA-binding protein/mannose-6-phosphate isomerase-like protein (Cupin superfamily) n=1 Tax=Paenibacillus phyllosphaerae TaxID=274593 RepID=A0A7W5FNA7_9BACL|nr:AraC family transcriptional regulator [Paenibacillus phyllosphaerae]MBB3110983.1 AraC-like DNA-binding protein/mannose-6-phosphate isomerase-like protein (cupin superfamily) [Paenibacillus phyllosphaerae]